MVLSNLLRTFSAECRFYFDDEVRLPCSRSEKRPLFGAG